MKYTLLILLIFSATVLSAQDTNYVDPDYVPERQRTAEKKSDFWDRLYYGGNFGLSFGSYTSILVEPMVGYKFTKKLSGGFGIGYRYGRGEFQRGGSFSYHNYIGRVFGRYLLIPNAYAHVEYMMESYDKIFKFDSQNRSFPNTTRTNVPFLFVGGGYRVPVGGGAFVIQVLFNVLQSNRNSSEVYPVGVPFISLGYLGGF